MKVQTHKFLTFFSSTTFLWHVLAFSLQPNNDTAFFPFSSSCFSFYIWLPISESKFICPRYGFAYIRTANAAHCLLLRTLANTDACMRTINAVLRHNAPSVATNNVEIRITSSYRIGNCNAKNHISF